MDNYIVHLYKMLNVQMVIPPEYGTFRLLGILLGAVCAAVLRIFLLDCMTITARFLLFGFWVVLVGFIVYFIFGLIVHAADSIGCHAREVSDAE